jgi:hypothetical protein
MNIKRHLLIFMLVSWLPMQSLAGALLHCEFIEHASAPVGEMARHTSHAGYSAAVSIEVDSEDCHGQPVLSSQIELIDTSAPGNDKVQCNHCNGSCHGLQQLSLYAMTNGFVSTLNSFPPSSTAGEISSIPENPQRPPKLS